MVGYDMDLVVDPDSVPQDLICSVCADICRDVVRTSCAHVFCRSCIESWIDKSNNNNNEPCCPQCRSVLVASESSSSSSNNNNNNNAQVLFTSDRILANIINGIKVRCVFHDKGCTWTGRLENLDAHIDSTPPSCQVIQKGCECSGSSCPLSFMLERAKQQVVELTKRNQALERELEERRRKESTASSSNNNYNNNDNVIDHLRSSSITRDVSAIRKVWASVGIALGRCSCDSCGKRPLLPGDQFRCVECINFRTGSYDLCRACFFANKHSSDNHTFVAI